MTSMKQNAAYHGAGIIFWTVYEQGIVTVLMGKRSVSPQKHRWSFPGGGWEHTDGFAANGSFSYETAALREASEEMGITAILKEQLALLWSLDIPFFHYRVFSRSDANSLSQRILRCSLGSPFKSSLSACAVCCYPAKKSAAHDGEAL